MGPGCGGGGGRESAEGGSPHLPASQWLCNEAGGLWVPVAGGERHASRVQEPGALHATMPFPCTQEGGAQVGYVRERPSRPAGGGHTPQGHCPLGPEVLLAQYLSTGCNMSPQVTRVPSILPEGLLSFPSASTVEEMVLRGRRGEATSMSSVLRSQG